MPVRHPIVFPLDVRFVLLFIGVLGSVGGAWLSESRAYAERVDSPPETIRWLSWDEHAFEQAKREDKLILLDLMAVWCHACHVMDETTYADPAVIRLVNERFIPIRVDTDQRPDIDVRYRTGGWPTTSILMPTGEILFQANALKAMELLDVLREVDRIYRENTAELQQQVAEMWSRVQEAQATRTYGADSIDPTVIAQSMMIMSQEFDPLYGGFRDKPKFFEPEAVTLGFLLAYEQRDPAFKRMALVTLDHQMKLIDPVWGGLYRYAEERDWTKPHYEKLLAIQAANLDNYLEAYQATELPRYRAVAEGIISYVFQFLADREHGGFYGSQDSVVRAGSDGRIVIPGSEYFTLDDAQRRQLGIPSVDRRIYTGWNGQMAKSFLKASQILDRSDVQAFALKTLNVLFARGYRPGQGMVHLVEEGKAQGRSYLVDQVLFGEGLLAAYLTTSERVYLQRAEAVVDDMVQQFEDREGGGLYDRPIMHDDRGLLRFPEKPLRINLRAALLFCDLYYVTEKQEYRLRAERTLHSVLGSDRPYPVAYTALAVHRFLHYPIHIVVVGEKTDPATEHLWHAAQHVYVPGKIVRLLDPAVDALEIGRISFPRFDSPRAYICSERVCSPPLGRHQELEQALLDVTTASGSASLPAIAP